jgi:hypothetical protein
VKKTYHRDKLSERRRQTGKVREPQENHTEYKQLVWAWQAKPPGHFQDLEWNHQAQYILQNWPAGRNQLLKKKTPQLHMKDPCSSSAALGTNSPCSHSKWVAAPGGVDSKWKVHNLCVTLLLKYRNNLTKVPKLHGFLWGPRTLWWGQECVFTYAPPPGWSPHTLRIRVNRPLDTHRRPSYGHHSSTGGDMSS